MRKPPGATDVAVLSDEDLMSRAQRNEASAFAELFDRHAGQALGIAHAICRDRGRAEETVQEAFLDVWRGRNTYRVDAGPFKAWAMTLVRRRAIDRVRSEARRPPLAGSHVDPADEHSRSAQDDVVARDEAETLLTLIGKLPRDQGEVIALAFYGQLSHSEIAAQIGLPLGTVKGRMRLGLEKLRLDAAARFSPPISSDRHAPSRRRPRPIPQPSSRLLRSASRGGRLPRC